MKKTNEKEKTDSKLLKNLSDLKDKSLEAGKKVHKTLETKLGEEKGKIQEQMGDANIKSGFTFYKKKAAKNLTELKKDPAATIGKFLLRNTAKTTGFVAKKTGQSIGNKIRKTSEKVVESIKNKSADYITKEVTKNGLNGMSKPEKIALAAAFGLSQKVGAVVETGKMFFGKLKKHVGETTAKKLYEACLPGSDLLIEKVIQHYHAGTMQLTNNEGLVNYVISSVPKKGNVHFGKKSRDLEGLSAHSDYNNTLEDGTVLDVKMDLRYARPDKNKSREEIKQELDNLVQKAILDLLELEELNEITKTDNRISFTTEDGVKKDYLCSLNKKGEDSGVVIFLSYMPLKKDNPSMSVTYKTKMPSPEFETESAADSIQEQ